MPDQLPPVFVAVNRYRALLLRRDAAAATRLVDAYRSSLVRLQDKIDLLATQIGDKQPTRGQLVRMTRYRDLMAQVGEELRDLQGLTRSEIDALTRQGIQLGERHGRELISYAATGTPRIAGVFNGLPQGAIRQLLGFLEPDGALFQRLALMAAVNADGVSEAIISGAALGYNPRRIAAEITRRFGVALTDALRFTRTAELYAYREASRAVYVANGDVVQGWVWHANLGDPRTCMSCIAMHGTVHRLDERLNDHHQGRCAAIPLVAGYDNPVTQTGRDWFEQQAEATQRNLMGGGKYDAWRSGRFDFGQLSTTYDDPAYGVMRRVAALKDLVGEP